MSQTRGIVVAGMHRSGTSATAGGLSQLGVSLGSKLLDPGEDNPTGYWEHERAVLIHEELLHALDRRWDDVRALPAQWRATAAAQRARKAIDALLDEDFAVSKLWAVKDPRICRLLPLWTDAAMARGWGLGVLLVVRDPSEVAASLLKRNCWEPAVSHVLWLRHVFESVRHSAPLARVLITYRQLLVSPGETLVAALQTLGAPLPTGINNASLESFIDPAARHHTSDQDTIRAQSPWLDLCLRVHDAAQAIANGSSDWSVVAELEEEFNRDWATCAATVESVADMAQKLSLIPQEVDAALADAKSRLTSQVAWSEQAAKQIGALQFERDVARSELAAQLSWSEDAVLRIDTLQVELATVRSELNAQIAWSENAAKKLEALQAERDSAKSDLTAQIEWSENAVKQHEALQGEQGALASALAAQTRWSEDAARKIESLQAERDSLSSDLTAQVRWSEGAAAQLADLQAEKATAQSELNAQIAWSENAAKKLEALQADLAHSRSGLIAQLDWARTAVDQLEALHADLASARSELNAQLEWAEAAVEQREALYAELAGVRSELNAQLDWAQTAVRKQDALYGELAETHQACQALEAALDQRTEQRDDLQWQVDRYEATLLGRFHRRWLDRKPVRRPASPPKETE